MLLELHVKNLALIERADVEFGEGLNILTGETGAGKSIIIGSVSMALGGKASRDSIRHERLCLYRARFFSQGRRQAAGAAGTGYRTYRGWPGDHLKENHPVTQYQPHQ